MNGCERGRASHTCSLKHLKRVKFDLKHLVIQYFVHFCVFLLISKIHLMDNTVACVVTCHSVRVKII